MVVHRIPIVNGISSEDFYKEYVETGKPVILGDAARNWPAVSKWTEEYIIEKCGNRPVTLRALYPDRPMGKNYASEESTISAYISRLRHVSARDPYIAERPLGEVLPNLVSDIGVSPYRECDAASLSLMLGAKSIAPLHYHPYQEAISYQITGSRRFVLFPPRQTTALDPLPATGPLPNFARSVINEDELDAIPGDVFDATIKGGEAIYIPVHWWHTVFSSDEMSILLVDFFDYDLATERKNEVTERIEFYENFNKKRKFNLEYINTIRQWLVLKGNQIVKAGRRSQK